MKIHPIILSLLFLPFLITCSQNDTVGPKPLENIGEQVFCSIDMQDQTHINVKNDSGGVYIYGYWNQDIIETMLYRTVSAESRTAAQERLLDVQLQHSRSEETIDIFATINTHPGRLRYSSWYNLELDNKLVLNIQDIPDDITVFDMDTTLMVTDAGHNVSIVRHMGSAQVNTFDGDIYMEIILPDSGYCRGETGDGDIVVRVPIETSARIFLKSHQGLVAAKNLEVKDEVANPGSLEGILDLGEGEIVLETTRGSIILYGF